MAKRKPKRKYDADTFKKALQSIINGSMTAYKASKVYQIPDQTLRDHINNKCVNSRPGAATVLMSSEEAVVVKWIHHMSKIGFTVTKEQLLYSVAKLVKDLNKPNTFKNGVPGRHWYEGFFKRHPNIRHKVRQVLKVSRINATEETIRKWFKNVYKYFEDIKCVDVLEDPSRIFTCDEFSVYICPKGESILARKGKARNLESENNDNECLNVSLGVSAIGKLIPILALFHVNQKPNINLQKYPKSWDIGQSCNGEITCETFYKYISQVFNKYLIDENIKKPIVLFLDGQITSLSLSLTAFCEENGIIIMPLLPILTHSLQPMDVAVCHDLKKSWSASVQNWSKVNNAQKLTIEDFGTILDECIKETLQPQCIMKGFLFAGLYPFNENAVDYSRIINSTQSRNGETASNSSSDENIYHYDEKSVPDELPQMNNTQNIRTLQKRTLPNRPSIEFVAQFEKQLGTKKLKEFRECVGIWHGNVRDTNLYYLWRRISNQSSLVSNNCTILRLFQTLLKDHL